MPLSEKTRSLVLAPFEVSRIVSRFAFPGILGFALLGLGLWRKIAWLQWTGLALAAPVLWAYAVLMLVYIPMLAVEHIREAFRKDE